jgi:alpha-L-fucosidase
MANGQIPQASIERLSDVGDWMRVNSSSIYGTTASPFVRLKWGRATKKEYGNATDLFLHVFDWPENGQLEVAGLNNEISSAYFLADFQKKIDVIKTANGVTLKLPKQSLDNIDTVIVLKLKGTLDVTRILPTQAKDGVLALSLDDANIHNPGYGGKLTIQQTEQGSAYLSGWTDHESHVDWRVSIEQPGRFELYADVAGKEKSGFNVKVGDKEYTASSQKTGSLEQFNTQNLGTLELPKGEVVIKFEPDEAQWNTINMRSIRMIPVH